MVRRLGHVPELDLVRGAALVLVVLSHLFIIWPTWVLEGTVSRGGFLGVDLFFVLSGFLITALLLEEQAQRGVVRLGAFYWRRALRLLPALALLLVAHLAYAVVDGYPPFGRSDFEWRTLRAGALFHMNWHVLWNPLEAADLTPLWSVAIEGQFYLVWPLVVLGVLGLRRSPVAGAGFLLALFTAVSVWRLVLFETEGWEASYLRSDAHVEGLVIGALIGCAWIRGWTPDHLPRWLLWPAAAVLALLVTQLGADERLTYAGGTTLFVLAGATVVLVLVTAQRPLRGPAARALAFLGRVSYGVYLWHFPVLWAVTRDGTHLGNGERLLLATATTAAGVTASRLLVEVPALRLKGLSSRRARARRPAVTGADGAGATTTATPGRR
jgi:peptidoglycan/LPS O-acetylase OafA/YrhL